MKAYRKYITNENLTLKCSTRWEPKQKEDEAAPLNRSNLPAISALICKRLSLQPRAAMMPRRFGMRFGICLLGGGEARPRRAGRQAAPVKPARGLGGGAR